ncbi:MAG TPA: hypothetical protein VNA25_30085 [Phycisphaerae bacterium]|nr:hypothetical protein [Phycisphaerae bacterium]
MALASYAKAISGGLLADSDLLSKQVVYTPDGGGTSLPRYGSVDRSAKSIMMFEDMIAEVTEAVLFISNDTSTGLSTIELGDKIVIDSTNFRVVDRIPPGLDGVWRVALKNVDPSRRGANFLDR